MAKIHVCQTGTSCQFRWGHLQQEVVIHSKYLQFPQSSQTLTCSDRGGRPCTRSAYPATHPPMARILLCCSIRLRRSVSLCVQGGRRSVLNSVHDYLQPSLFQSTDFLNFIAIELQLLQTLREGLTMAAYVCSYLLDSQSCHRGPLSCTVHYTRGPGFVGACTEQDISINTS